MRAIRSARRSAASVPGAVLGAALLCASAPATAEPLPPWGDRFLEIRLGPSPSREPVAERARSNAEEADRSVRDRRRAREERRLRRHAAPDDVRRYRLRERRADQVDRVLRSVRDGPREPAHAERVRRDIRDARDGVELERRIRTLERRARAAADRRRTPR